MEETIVKFENEAKELKKYMIQAALDSDIDITDTEDENAVVTMRCMKFVDATCKLIAEQSKTIEEINSKLNILLNR